MPNLIRIIVPEKIRNSFAQLLIYADIKKDPNKYLSFLFLTGLLYAVLASLLIQLIFKINFVLPLIIAFILIEFAFYYIILLKADKKTQIIEEHLSDALQLMSSNLRAGLTVDRALLLSTRPEFGVLTKEINLVGKQIIMGKSITDSLSEMVKRVKGKTFSKTMQLIISGIRSGGELAVLLDKTAQDLVQKKLVTKKIKTSINLYVIFIFVAIGVGGPLLFGLSSYLIGVLTEILTKVAIPKTPGVNLPFKISTVPTLDQAFVMQYSVAFLVTSVVLGSLVLGLINKGKEKEGVKYILPLMVIALTLFFIVRILVKNLLGASLVIT